MSSEKKKLENSKDKLAGETKEAFGKLTGNEQLELKGKLQSAKADFKKKTNVKDNVEKAKENLAGKANDMIDKKEAKKNKKK
ncbi:MAG: CsbD family protein [Clostridiales bacterium]|nr:CsbD family protein [Clostridiales bacterium]